MNGSENERKDQIRISDEAVREATGKGWDEWEEVLDGWGAADLAHREIVALLKDRGGVSSGWWRQGVANGYEKLKGRRILGETEGTGFQIGVQRTLPIALDEAWRLLTSTEGVRAWLGGAPAFRLDEAATGEVYRLADGARGEVRVVHPRKHLRITRHPEEWPRPSTIQARVEAKGGKTVIGFHEENLPDQEERESRRAHFRAALDRLAGLAALGK